MAPSYYVFPGLKLSYLTDGQREGIKRENLMYFRSKDISNAIMNVVCEYYGFTPEQLAGKRGKGILPWARHAFCYLMRKYTRHPVTAIGFIINRDHTTVIHSIRVVNDNIEVYPQYKDQITAIERILDDRLYRDISKIKEKNQISLRAVEEPKLTQQTNTISTGVLHK